MSDHPDMSSPKRPRADPETTADGHGNQEDDKDRVIAELRAEIARLRDREEAYYASNDCLSGRGVQSCIPRWGSSARHVKERIVQTHELDNKPRLNTSSYVNVVQEPEEDHVALLGLGVNLADASVYPASVGLHDTVVNMIAQLWHCPPPPSDQGGNYSGAGTVGSTEACLLAGLAHKFRWREWYRKKHNLDACQVQGVVPNLVISSCYQAAWEKFFRYFDVEPRYVKPTLANVMRMDASLVEGFCDDKTLAVVGILGNHYNGAYDPIWDIDKAIEEVNAKNGWQIGIHVDAASGGFIAPFQEGMPPFDFRLKNVLSISASGHKFGESSCGTGWLVFRHREDLASHIAISVTYLGGKSDSMTLNFSRPATSVYVQYYKLLRLGWEGYRKKVDQQMKVSKFLRDYLKSATFKGKPRFELLDAGDEHCLPVVAARLNPELKLKYNDIDLQHGVAEYHWYVSGYSLNFENYMTDKPDLLCTDARKMDTMFRIVVKSNLTMYLAQDLVSKLDEVLPLLDQNAATKPGEHRAPSLRAMVYATKAAGLWASAAGAAAASPKARRESILHGQHATC